MPRSTSDPPKNDGKRGVGVSEGRESISDEGQADHQQEQQPGGQQSAAGQRENRPEGGKYRKRRYGRRCALCMRRYGPAIEALSAAIIAAFTVMLYLVGNRQWSTTRDALEETRRSNEATLRAWVMLNEEFKWIVAEGVEPPQHVPPIPPDGLLGIKLGFTNFGKLPALYVQTQMETGVFKEFPATPPYRAVPPNIRDPPSLSSYAPGVKFSVIMDVRQLTPEERASVNDGTAGLFVYGYSKYWDQFGSERGLIFCEEANQTQGLVTCAGYNLPW